jgi:hypothetical protein
MASPDLLHGLLSEHALVDCAEHVGTKTAVQIRSHAQKFFNKLETGKGINEDGEL